MKYYVEYNAKFIAMYKSIKPALRFIAKKGYKNDDNNLLYLVDSAGNRYDPVTGNEIEY